MPTPLDPSYHLYLAEARRASKHDGVIRRGSDYKKAVKALQKRLGNLGYEVSTDGIFGHETEQALKAFQRKNGLQIDAVVGPKTLDALLDAKRPKGNGADPALDAIQKVVTNGAAETETAGKGLGDVRALQRGGGTDPSTEGRGKGRGTSSATKKGPYGGTIDGSGNERASTTTGPIGSTKVPKPDKMSWEKGGKHSGPHDPQDEPENDNPEFNEKHPRGPGGKFAAKGDSGEEVQNAQSALNRVTDADLDEDGQFGDKTDAAVRKYQRKAGLRVDGVVGPRTSASLRRRLKLQKRKSAKPTGAGDSAS